MIDPRILVRRVLERALAQSCPHLLTAFLGRVVVRNVWTLRKFPMTTTTQIPTCKHCGEEIGQLNNDHVWYHEIDCGPDRHQSCDCHCAECDPRGGYADGRACIDGESAEPEGEAA